eukprot:scaffold40729_cov139-Skeletonema_dohrnii-CCMP3373.AAC.1
MEQSGEIISSSSPPLPPPPTAVEQAINNVNDTTNDDSTVSNNSIEASSLLEHYESLIASGEVTRDPHQIRALRELDRFRVDCLSYVASPSFHCNDDDDNSSANGDVNGGGDGWSMASLFSSWGANSASSSGNAAASSLGSHNEQSLTAEKPKGVYLHGGVGC